MGSVFFSVVRIEVLGGNACSCKKKFWQYNMSFDRSLSGCRLEFVTTQKLVGGFGHISNVEFWEQTSCLFWAYLFLSL